MGSYRKVKFLRINCWIGVISGFFTFISGCWFTYDAFYQPSQEEYEQEKMENNFTYQKNGTRFEFNGMYGPVSLVVNSSLLVVCAGFAQTMNALAILFRRPIEKMIGKTGNYVAINAFITVALVLSLIVTIVTDPARSFANPSEEFKKGVFTFIVMGKNSFAIILSSDITLLTISILCMSIFDV